MPELPEVETTRRGLAPHLEGRRVVGVTLRRPDLRWPIPHEIETLLPSQAIVSIKRRAKYLLMETAAGSALWHLGMSGSLRVLPADTPVRAHDHVDVSIEGKGRAAGEERGCGKHDGARMLSVAHRPFHRTASRRLTVLSRLASSALSIWIR